MAASSVQQWLPVIVGLVLISFAMYFSVLSDYHAKPSKPASRILNPNDPVSQTIEKFRKRVAMIQSGELTDAPFAPESLRSTSETNGRPQEVAAQQDLDAEGDGFVTGDGKDWTVNYVFTTTCSHGQDLNSEGLIYSFAQRGVRGKLTRLDSCSKPWTYPKIWAKNYNIVQVKHYGPLHNKPGALGEWLTDHASDFKDDTTIVILDPDMMLGMSPPFDEVLFGRPAFRHFGGERGRAAGELYGIGTAWLDKVNFKQQCKDAGGNCDISHDEAFKYFTAGPPLIIHKDDLKKMAPMWLNYTDQLWKAANKQGWAFDMDGYSMGMVQIGVRHNISAYLMTGDPHVCAEGWNKIPGLECAEKFPKQFDIDPSYVSNHRSVLHYCHFYKYPKHAEPAVPGFMFGKYEFVDGRQWAKGCDEMFDCSKPRFEVPVDQSLIDKVDMNGGKGDTSEDVITRRTLYMIVNVIQNMNAAFKNYRAEVCK